MPAKTTTKTSSKTTKTSEKKLVSKKDVKKSSQKTVKKEEKKDTKKVVVKRRKTDLKPTKASAVAIVSQANRAKKQALIEKVANSDIIPSKSGGSSDTKIPLWVWIFFGCSLLLFCVSFYQAIIRPQIEKENVVVSDNWIDESVDIQWQSQDIDDKYDVVEGEDANQVEVEENEWVNVPETANEAIDEFFVRLSNRDFDWAFDLMTPTLRGYPDIKNHFTSFRMDPFLDGVEWWRLKPENIQYIKSPAYWKDVYNIDLSYVMSADQEKFEETWEFGVNSSSGEPKISSIRCISSKCSYHPIFWPENYGLMR